MHDGDGSNVLFYILEFSARYDPLLTHWRLAQHILDDYGRSFRYPLLERFFDPGAAVAVEILRTNVKCEKR